MIARDWNAGEEMLPALVRLEPKNLVLARFPLLKMLPAAEVIADAINGGLPPGTTLIDTTSGTWGHACGRITCLYGLPLRIVTDPAVDPAFARILRDLGVTVDIVTPVGDESPQNARIDRLEELLATGKYRCLDQYGNPAARRGYAPVAELLLERIGRVDVLVGAVGSGASCSGIATYYRTVYPELRLVGVDCFNSVLFGLPDGPRVLRGLGNSVHPPNLLHTQFDAVHWVDAPLGFAATRRLHRETTEFRGPTTGAAWWIARSLAMENPDLTVVVLSADNGWRYVNTVYSDDWLRSAALYLDPMLLPAKPEGVACPSGAIPPWSAFEWGRRAYADVLGAPLVQPLR